MVRTQTLIFASHGSIQPPSPNTHTIRVRPPDLDPALSLIYVFVFLVIPRHCMSINFQKMSDRMLFFFNGNVTWARQKNYHEKHKDKLSIKRRQIDKPTTRNKHKYSHTETQTSRKRNTQNRRRRNR